jgi:hypothetical protein
MNRVEAMSYPVSIFIAGSYEGAHNACQAYCRDVGLCVTVTPTSYVYTGGQEGGVIVGLINYPRFPSEAADIFARACDLAEYLRRMLRQESYTVQAPDKTVWFSHRAEDAA